MVCHGPRLRALRVGGLFYLDKKEPISLLVAKKSDFIKFMGRFFLFGSIGSSLLISNLVWSQEKKQKPAQKAPQKITLNFDSENKEKVKGPSKTAAQNSKASSGTQRQNAKTTKPVPKKSVLKPTQKVAGEKNASGSKSSGSQKVKSLTGWTRTVRASDQPKSASLFETLALAVDNQYLVVPWSFVSDANLTRNGIRFFLNESDQEATLVDLDIASNIALLKTGSSITPSFNRSQIRLTNPVSDEPLFVLAARDWLRPGARFLRTKSDGSNMQHLIGNLSGDYASARFVFDKSGQLVALASPEVYSNSSKAQDFSSDERIWSSSAKALFEILKRQDGPKPASVSTSYMKRRELYYWQERWTRALVPNQSALDFGALECRGHLALIPDQALAAQVQNVRGMECDGKASLRLGGGYSAGLKVWTGEAKLRSANESTAPKLVQALSSQVFSELNKNSSMINLMTVPDCGETNVQDRRGQNVQVKFCTTGLKIEPGLNDTVVSVSSTDAGERAFFAFARLKGFDQGNTKKIIESLVENVRGIK